MAHTTLRRHTKSKIFDLSQENAKLRGMVKAMGELLESAIPAMIIGKRSLRRQTAIFKTEGGEEEPSVMLSAVDHGFMLEEYRIWKEAEELKRFYAKQWR